VHYSEDWVERELGCLSGRTRGRVVRDPAHVAVSVELDRRAIQRSAMLAGMELNEDGALVGLRASQAHIDALLAAPAAAATCRALGRSQSFPHAVDEHTVVMGGHLGRSILCYSYMHEGGGAGACMRTHGLLCRDDLM
jgi:hypothetical protein